MNILCTQFYNIRIHAQGNPAKQNNHPDGRAIMFEGQTYSKKRIIDFITTLNGFEDVLKVIALFEGNYIMLYVIIRIVIHIIYFLDFCSTLISKCTKVEPGGEFPSLRESLDYFKVIN